MSDIVGCINMDIPDLIYDVRAGVAWITINRPERRNALGNTTTRQLLDACEYALADEQVRVLVITGQGDAFCAGGDVQDTFQRGANNTEHEWSERIRNGPNQVARLLRCASKPVIACVNGVAVGGGATIALACDLRVASGNARFCFPFVRIGITPEFGCTWLLQRTVGLGRANELLLLADFLDADTALRYGLVNQVVAPSQLVVATERMAARLVGMPASAMARVKQLQLFAQQNDFNATLEQEALALGASFTSDEHREAVARFLDRKSSPSPAR